MDNIKAKVLTKSQKKNKKRKEKKIQNDIKAKNLDNSLKTKIQEKRDKLFLSRKTQFGRLNLIERTQEKLKGLNQSGCNSELVKILEKKLNLLTDIENTEIKKSLTTEKLGYQ